MSRNRNQKKAILTYVYDPSGDSSVRTKDVTYTLEGVPVPDNAIITDSWIDVLTTFTSATDAATIAVSTGQGAGDLVAATAISDARNIWDTSATAIKGTLITAPNLGADAAHDSALETIDLFKGVKLKMSANRQPTVAVAVEDLTAGKFVLYIEYIMSIEA